LIGSAIGFYFLFQIRDSYGASAQRGQPAVAAKPAKSTKKSAKKSTKKA
jgi:hypothetical protein